MTSHSADTARDPVRNAFPARRPLPPWALRRPLPEEQIAGAWARLLETPAPARKRLAYVHVPFCANHCLFCGFYQQRAHAAALPRYARAIVADLVRESSAPAVAAAPIHAVYLGGGTPTALDAGDLDRLVRALRQHLPLTPDCEVTVEGRALHFDDARVDACLAAGANRFSIGVQSFDTGVRRRQGRRASRSDLLRFLRGLIARDRAAIVIDLLIGLPGQTPSVWRRDLETCIALEPDGVDLYALNVFPGTPLERAIAAGKCAPAAPLPEIGTLYAEGVAVLREAGWRQISNSHFARTTRERNLYNLLIKQGADCLAYGAGAGGSLGAYSYSLARDPEHYVAAVERGVKPIASLSEAGPRRELYDRVIGGLEEGRLDLVRAGAAAHETVAPLVLQWHAAGLLEDASPVLRLTTAGRFWATNLTRALLEDLDQSQAQEEIPS